MPTRAPRPLVRLLSSARARLSCSQGLGVCFVVRRMGRPAARRDKGVINATAVDTNYTSGIDMASAVMTTLHSVEMGGSGQSSAPPTPREEKDAKEDAAIREESTTETHI